jgi:hypothetical protein
MMMTMMMTKMMTKMRMMRPPMKTFPRNPRLLTLLLVLALGALAPACGGGGSDDGGGNNMGPLNATFTPGNTNPTPSTISMSGSAAGQSFSIVVQVTGVNDFFGTGFRVTFDPASAQFVGFSSAGSFLTGVGTSFDADVNPTNAGEVIVVATIQDATQPAGIDVAATATLITLNFQATNTTSNNPFAFAASRNVTVCPTQGGACNPGIAPTLTWSGGTMTATR